MKNRLGMIKDKSYRRWLLKIYEKLEPEELKRLTMKEMLYQRFYKLIGCNFELKKSRCF